MTQSEYYTEVSCIAQSVIPLMAQHKVAATPSNYSLFFRYLQGKEANLIASIDTYTKLGVAFTEEILQELKDEFPDPDIAAEIHKSHVNVSKIVSDMFLKISSYSGETGKLSKTIKNNAGKLSEISSIEEVSTVVASIIKEAEEFEEYNESFRTEMEELTTELEELKKEYAEIKTESRTDQLTKVPNRLALDEALKEDLHLCKSKDMETLSVMMVDIDHFKKFNDTFGHLTGDKVLKYVAQKIKKLIKGQDFIGRFGGEEFVILLPSTAINHAATVAEHIRNFFATTKLTGSNQNLGKITVSIGVTEYKTNDSSETIISRADKALYKAKKGGRNQVQCSD